MKFIKLSAKNLYSFKELSFEFVNRGTTLILGKNLDQSTSNGAGKSSIIKSIFFALWGKELNGESVDLIRKRDEKDGYIVELEFEDRGHNYKIERYRDRKDKENKTGVDFYIDGKIFNGETSSDTQKIIERKIKISAKLFLSSILTAQNETKHFLTVNDTEKKELFSELLDLTVYSKSFDLVKEEISSKEKELDSINLKIETLEQKIKERRSECETLEEKNDSFEDERVTKEAQLKKKIEDLRNSKGQFDENEIETIEKSLNSLSSDLEKIDNQISRLAAVLEDESVFSDLYNEYINEETKIIRDIEKNKLYLEQAKDRILKLEGSISLENKAALNAKRSIDSIVPEERNKIRTEFKSVEQAINYSEEFISSYISSFKDEMKSLEEKVSLYDKKISELDPILAEKNAKKEKIKGKLDLLSPQKKEKSLLEKSRAEIDKKIKDFFAKKQTTELRLKSLHKIDAEIETVSTIISENKEKKNPYRDLIEITKQKVSENELALDAIKRQKDKIQDDLKYLLFWRAAFSPLGIRSFIFDEVLELLNQKVQSNLNDLFEGALSVVFESESKTNKGNISNKINTKFFLSGKETTFGLLSGGEQQRSILAVNLALSEVAEAYSGTLMNIKFLDEPFNGIDSSGQIQCFRLFNRIAQTKELYVISHDESFQQLCPNAIYLVKKNGGSKIVDRAEFESNIN